MIKLIIFLLGLVYITQSSPFDGIEINCDYGTVDKNGFCNCKFGPCGTRCIEFLEYSIMPPNSTKNIKSIINDYIKNGPCNFDIQADEKGCVCFSGNIHD